MNLSRVLVHVSLEPEWCLWKEVPDRLSHTRWLPPLQFLLSYLDSPFVDHIFVQVAVVDVVVVDVVVGVPAPVLGADIDMAAAALDMEVDIVVVGIAARTRRLTSRYSY